jgi:hypothetical protein
VAIRLVDLLQYLTSPAVLEEDRLRRLHLLPVGWRHGGA